MGFGRLNKLPVWSRQAPQAELCFARVVSANVQASNPTDAQNLAALPEGYSRFVATKTGTGVYVLTLKDVSTKSPVVVGVTPIGDSVSNALLSAVEITGSGKAWTALTVRFFSKAGTTTPVDADFHITAWTFQTPRSY